MNRIQFANEFASLGYSIEPLDAYHFLTFRDSLVKSGSDPLILQEVAFQHYSGGGNLRKVPIERDAFVACLKIPPHYVCTNGGTYETARARAVFYDLVSSEQVLLAEKGDLIGRCWAHYRVSCGEGVAFECV